MTRRFINSAIVYALIAMAGGVFYREFTKLIGFADKTNLSLIHTHYFVLGMFFFLILAILDKAFGLSGEKQLGKILVLYHVGLNITGAALFLRGLVQALNTQLPKAMDAALSGTAGLGHILLGVSILLFLFLIKKVMCGGPDTTKAE